MKLTSHGKEIIITDFDEIDALRLAVKLEADGIKYYTELAKKVGNEDMKKMLLRLAKEEEKHSAKFRAWLESRGGQANEEQDFEGIDTGVFGDIWSVDATLSKIGSDLDILSLGEWAELNSINFYKAILKNSESEPGKNTIKDIIKEEQDHLKAFARFKDLLEKKKSC